jgi:hypothetical protein
VRDGDGLAHELAERGRRRDRRRERREAVHELGGRIGQARLDPRVPGRPVVGEREALAVAGQQQRGRARALHGAGASSTVMRAEPSWTTTSCTSRWQRGPSRQPGG